jgi:tyrosine-specific transport protein
MFFGSFIPLIVYFIWELCILGTIPAQGAHGLTQAYLHDISLAKLLSIQVDNDFIIALAGGFSIFAIVTSFLGVAQGLFDFLKDGLRSNGISNSRPLAFILTFLPPILFLVFFERGFIVLLEYAGALVSIILGIIPILIVYRLRKRKGQIVEYRAPGNNFVLILGILFFVFVVLLVVLKNLGYINFFMD